MYPERRFLFHLCLCVEVGDENNIVTSNVGEKDEKDEEIEEKEEEEIDNPLLFSLQKEGVPDYVLEHMFEVQTQHVEVNKTKKNITKKIVFCLTFQQVKFLFLCVCFFFR